MDVNLDLNVNVNLDLNVNVNLDPRSHFGFVLGLLQFTTG